VKEMSCSGFFTLPQIAAGLDARTGGPLRISATDSLERGPDGSLVPGAANVVNVADIFERRYASYTNSLLQRQLDGKADIVVLQLGENVVMEAFHPDATGGNDLAFPASAARGAGLRNSDGEVSLPVAGG